MAAGLFSKSLARSHVYPGSTRISFALGRHPHVFERNAPPARCGDSRFGIRTQIAIRKRLLGTISFGINLFLFGNANGNLSNRAIEAYPFQIETIGKVSICGAEEIPSLHNSQSPLASASRSHADRKFSYQVLVNLVMICSAVCPAIFTPEWTMSPQVCTRVPLPECSSKLTHCARTTPSEWSIHPTLCAG